MSNRIILERSYLDSVTLGKMTLPDGKSFDTVELPWRGNRTSVSCIPEGTYTLKKRVSGVIQRTSRGVYTQGWEVTNVKGRTFIMIHVANKPSDIEGCIGIGQGINMFGTELGVSHSQISFKSFMDSLDKADSWELVIRTRTI